MAVYEIPLTPEPQAFGIRLGGVDYRLVFRWRETPATIAVPGGWFLDVLDGLSETPIAAGIPLTTGTDIAGQLRHHGITGGFYVATDGDTGAVPTLDTLGTVSRLYFVTTEGAV